MSETTLCRLAELPCGTARGASLGGRAFVLVRPHGAGPTEVYAYVNACPHRGTPQGLVEDRFLDAAGELLVCATHGAMFRIEDGYCIEGRSQGASLARASIIVRDGEVRALA